jgi:hypothetical protein
MDLKGKRGHPTHHVPECHAPAEAHPDATVCHTVAVERASNALKSYRLARREKRPSAARLRLTNRRSRALY